MRKACLLVFTLVAFFGYTVSVDAKNPEDLVPCVEMVYDNKQIDITVTNDGEPKFQFDKEASDNMLIFNYSDLELNGEVQDAILNRELKISGTFANPTPNEHQGYIQTQVMAEPGLITFPDGPTKVVSVPPFEKKPIELTYDLKLDARALETGPLTMARVIFVTASKVPAVPAPLSVQR